MEAVRHSLDSISTAAQPTVERRRALVIIGGGMAAIRLLEELDRYDDVSYDVTVFGDERHFGYNRIQLSPVLAGEKHSDELALKSEAWYQQQAIRVLSGASHKIVAINRAARCVTTAEGAVYRYDRLVIASGSRPALPPWFRKVQHDPAMMVFRSLDDVEQMQHFAANMVAFDTQRAGSVSAVVVGAGLLGLEAAYGLNKLGFDVTVVNRASTILNRQLDRAAAGLLQDTLEHSGIQFALGADISTVELGPCGKTSQTVKTIDMADGRLLTADLVVVTIGITPNDELGEACGLQTSRGITVNDCMQTSDPAIYAIGECVSHRRTSFGMVAPLYEQARVCANHLGELGYDFFIQKPLSARLKISGINLFSMGDIAENAAPGEVQRHDMVLSIPRLGVYKRLILANGKLVGVVLYGDVRDAGWYQSLIESGSSVDAYGDALLHGQRFLAAA
ncbi:NAD(P)/FAD-dependent oxidoreductase [Allohahella marinimesophila]|uniref:FAD-dependent oxidoreductase n=1 Tax=Allohahella marinimesophila TaxID=1054972 RepID=A0ABP7Q166_9GAMM